MLTRIKLLQSKYNLSNEFITEFISNEIHRQAIQDLEGALRNASMSKLVDIRSMLIGNDNIIGNPIQEPVIEHAITEDSNRDTRTSEDDVPVRVQSGRNLHKAKSKSGRRK